MLVFAQGTVWRESVPAAGLDAGRVWPLRFRGDTLPGMRRLFLGAADTARGLADHPRLVERWGRDGALELMTVGALFAHLTRAVTVVPGYLDGEGHPPLLDAPGYFLAHIPDADSDPDGELAMAVRSRAAKEAEAGPEALISRWDNAREELESRLGGEDPGRPITVRGAHMRIDDYLVTRMVELVVHADDLAASLDAPTPAFEAAITDTVIDCLVEIATRRHTPTEVIRAMTRVERSDPGVLRAL